MVSFLSKNEDDLIRKALEQIAESLGLVGKNEHTIGSSYIDYVWFKEIETEKILIAAFEIERGIPTNERIKKDIFNLIVTKAPKGFLIIAKTRIDKADEKRPWVRWFRNTFSRAFRDYAQIFSSFTRIELLDADKLLSTMSIVESRIRF